MGVAVVSVFNSHHFGAAGYYAALAAKRGMVGMVTSATRTIAVVPTRAKVPVLGTNPLAFAAPAKRNAPFLLDMATSAAANNKVKVYGLRGKPIPAGWVLDDAGAPVTDADAALEILYQTKKGGLTPLGGTAEMSSHKGYGLALMVHILGGTLPGASFSPIRVRSQKANDPDRLPAWHTAARSGRAGARSRRSRSRGEKGTAARWDPDSCVAPEKTQGRLREQRRRLHPVIGF